MEEIRLRTGEYVHIYPNPSKDYISVNAHVNNPSNIQMSIFDMQGKLIWTHSYKDGAGYFNKKINIGKLVSGMYILKFQDNGRVIPKKFIVK